MDSPFTHVTLRVDIFTHNIAIKKDIAIFGNFETLVSMLNQGKLLKALITLHYVLLRAYFGQ